MTNHTFGGMLVALERDFDLSDLLEKYSEDLGAIAPGRTLGLFWQAPRLNDAQGWNPEKDITDFFLGSPSAREKNDLWLFSANGAFRTYDEGSQLSKSYLWVLLRKSGDKAYKRVRDVSPEILLEAKIPVSDPAFTRDIANNVWHLREQGFEQEVASRLRALTTWPDENYGVVTKTGLKLHAPNLLDLRTGLIPRASKVEYSF